MKSITGVIVPLLTPRNLSDLPHLLDHVIHGGVSAVIILGTNGETLKLDQKKRIEVIDKAVKHLQNRVPMIIGISAATIAEALELTHISQDVGAFASFVIPHFWGGDGVQVIEELLASSTNNLIFYNYPALTAGRFLPIELARRFACEERILGIKDSSGDLEYFDKLLKTKKHSNFKIYYGREQNLPEVFEKGIDGIVPGCANLDPRLASQVWLKKGEGLWPEWETLRSKIKEAGSGNYILGLKVSLKELGLLSDAGLWG